MQAQIIKIHSDFYYVEPCSGTGSVAEVPEVILECKIREILKKQKIQPLVGDFAQVKKITENSGVIEQILERKNFITRPAVANIDEMIVVSSVKSPVLDFIQLNRYLTLCKYHKIDAILCFNKSDLASSPEDKNLIENIRKIYEPLGYKILFTSAKEKTGLDELREVMKNKLIAFCGMSGVGKSSLINAINPNLSLRVKKVSGKTGRGVHTTRHCEIISFKETTDRQGGGIKIRIVDTPGFSNVKFDFLTPEQLEALFDEFQNIKNVTPCKFSNCSHTTEENCAVTENLDKIPPSRYDSYINLLQEAKLYKEKLTFQGSKTETSVKLNGEKKKAKINVQSRTAARSTLKQQIQRETDL